MAADTIRISGQLSEDARAIYGTDGWIVRLVIAQKTCTVPYLVDKPYGKDQASSIAARSAAANMRKGSTVHAHGDGLRQKRIGGTLYLRLQTVTLIEHHTPSHHTEQEAPCT
jgi:D-tyrosyl-tRNA(Tyr) deacylase